MITVNTRAGLLGMGDLGLVVPAGNMSGPEDTLILGLGRKMQRGSVLLGAISNRMSPASALPVPSTTSRVPVTSVVKPATNGYIAPVYSPMPKVPMPTHDVRTPEPGVAMMPPRQISPSGSSQTWTKTPISPRPYLPPVKPPAIPQTPPLPDNPLAYQGESAGDYAVDPYAGRAAGDAAGVQTAITDPSTDGSGTGTGTGEASDSQSGVATAGSAAWQWAKDNKGTIGIVAAVAVGAIVLAKVL